MGSITNNIYKITSGGYVNADDIINLKIDDNTKLSISSNQVGILSVLNVNSTGNVSIGNTSSTHLYINGTSGNIGIGTINPSSKLDVNGNINIPIGSNFTIGGTPIGSGGGTYTAGSNIGITSNIISVIDSPNFSGNVGIGSELDVNSNIKFKSKLNSRGTVLNNNSSAGNSYTFTSQNLIKKSRTSYANTINCISNWYTRSSVSSFWTSICWSPLRSLFVAVSGTESKIMKSSDGINWVSVNVANSGWSSVCWSEDVAQFVATGENGAIMTSTNGDSWTFINAPKNTNWTSVCWCPELSLFVSVTSTRSDNIGVMTSTNGFIWIGRDTSNISGTAFYSVCWSPELYMFVAVGNNCIMTSSDGITWIERNVPQASFWISVCWSSELSIFLAVSNDGTNKVMRSSDGINWTLSNVFSHALTSVCWSPEMSVFVAVSETETTRILTSHNGINWNLRTAPENNSWISVCWSPELSIFSAVSYDGTNRVMTSDIGIPNSKSTLLVSPAHMSINTSSGNVGIGTTNPLHKLHVQGAFYTPPEIYTTQLNVWTGGASFGTNPTITVKLLKIGDIVTVCVPLFVFGLFNSGQIKTSTTLPVGFRPSTAVSSHTRVTENGSYSVLTGITTNGDILIYGNLNGDGFNGGGGTTYTVNGFSVSYSV